MKRILTVLFLVGLSAHAAVFDLEALMAMTQKDEEQKVAPPPQASPEQRAFIRKWSEIGPLYERQLILRRQIDDLVNNIDEEEFNEPTSWMDMFRKKKDSPRVAGLKRQLNKVEKELSDITDKLWRYYKEQAEENR
ncbi:MAG: hypothetical protein F2923_00270 [Actinobacteria bacterium]|uniref:Unannotated protein n=1 Tax=freshwater metagenome TaxID=449393 RepID=A0A6J7RWE7_9ZZZZ|nr:hypothetical protein [Actinomycetota bacterium]